MFPILYCLAPCGGGKTHRIVQRAVQLAKEDHIVLILQPTTELIDKTIAEELAVLPNLPPHFVFHSKVKRLLGKGIGIELANHLKDVDVGQIIFATHQVLEHIPFLPRKRDIHLIIDEAFDVYRADKHQLPATHALVTDELALEPHNSVYGLVQPKDTNSLQDMALNRERDDILESINKTARVLSSEHWESFVDVEKYNRLLTKNGETQLTFFSLLKPALLRGFASVFIAAANFEDSYMYKLWSGRYAKFIRDTEFESGLRYCKHTNGSLLKIHYVTDDDWSKRLGTKIVGEETIIDRLFGAAKKLFGDQPFLWQANKSVKDDPFGEQAVRLPNLPHGINSHSGVHNIVFASALNPLPDEFKFLQTQGLTSDEIRKATYYSAAYQSVMRTSARSPTSTEPVMILVPDRGFAEYLLGQFPGATLLWLDAGVPKGSLKKSGGRPRKYASAAERGRAQRAAAKAKKNSQLQALLSSSSQHDIKMDCVSDNVNDRVEITIDSIRPICTAVFHGSIFNYKKHTYAAGYVKADSEIAFAVALSYAHDRTQAKDSNQLISPSFFDPDLAPGHGRSTDNVVYCRHIWLDFENGHLEPQEFAKLFPTIKMIVTNTSRHTKEHPRYRVIIFTTTTMTGDEHGAVIESIKWKLEDAGYLITKPKRPTNRPLSGLDTSKLSPTSLFALPAQANDPTQSFFEVYEDGREVLDPQTWIANSPILMEDVESPPLSNQEFYEDKDRLIQATKEEWRLTPKGQGLSNEAFFQLAYKLWSYGLSESSIRAELYLEAAYDNAPQDRRSQIKSIMDSLHKYRRSAFQMQTSLMPCKSV